MKSSDSSSMPNRNTLSLVIRALRPHQWVKNTLVFLPLILAHQITDSTRVVAAWIAFAAFCLCASAGYVLNDLLDREADRAHPSKSNRPFASGELPATLGVILAILLATVGIAISWLFLPTVFAGALLAYLVLTIAYSMVLKQRLLVDVVVLAGLYTLRVIGGAFAIDVPLTQWLLAFSMFFFLSLAFVKRYVELLRLRDFADQLSIQRRGYRVQDIDIIESVGPASGYLSVLVLSLYINAEIARDLYRRPHLLWLVCPILLYWITRVWFLARRRAMHDDPILFALRDRVSWIAVVLTGALVLLATLNWG